MASARMERRREHGALTRSVVFIRLAPRRENPLQVPRDALGKDEGVLLDVLDVGQRQGLQKAERWGSASKAIWLTVAIATALHPPDQACPESHTSHTPVLSWCGVSSLRLGSPAPASTEDAF